MDRVNEVTKEVFNALAQVRRADERSQPMPEMLYQRMRSFVDRAMRRASELGFSQQDVQDTVDVLCGSEAAKKRVPGSIWFMPLLPSL